MKQHLFYLAIIALLLLFASVTMAQNAAKPIRSINIVQPEVLSNGIHVASADAEILPGQRVTFHLQAPDAKVVKIDGGQINEQAMNKDDNGAWSVTVSLAPGFVPILFIVDDVKLWTSLEMPGDHPLFYEKQKLPHGTVTYVQYPSTMHGVTRTICIYTPPGYETGKKKYPVLYLLHGSGDNETSWPNYGHANFIMDNFIAKKKARAMIIVMPNAARPADSQMSRGQNRNWFSQEMLTEVIPFVEGHYRVYTDPLHRAVAGLSMGGSQSLDLGLNHADVFPWIGAFSAPARMNITADPAVLTQQLKLFWMGCGKSDGFLESNQQLDAAMTEKKIPHTLFTMEGSHEWNVWRNCLHEFMPKLFVGVK